MSKESYVSSRMANNLLVSVIIATLSTEAPVLLNPIFAGNFLGGNAIAAIAMSAPLIELRLALIDLFALGTSYFVAELISSNETRRVNGHFTVSLISTAGIMLLLNLAVFIFRDTLSQYLCGNNEDISGLMKEYLVSMSLSFVPAGLFTCFLYHLRSDGKLKLTIVCSIIVSVVNLLSTVAFLSFTGAGIRSFAFASVLSYSVGTLIFLLLMKSKSSLRFAVRWSELVPCLKTNLKNGFPILAESMLFITFCLITNLIIVNKASTDDAIVWSVASSIILIGGEIQIFLTESSLTLGKAMAATNDYHSCRQIIDKYRRMSYLSTLVIISFTVAFPKLVMALFGEPSMTDPTSITHLRLSSSISCIIPIAVYEATNYYLLDLNKKYIASLLLFYLGPALVLFAFSGFGSEYMWWCFAACTAASLLITTFIRREINKRIKSLSGDHASVELFLGYEMSSIESAVNSIRSFLEEQKVSDKSILAAEHCVEELSYNIIKHVTEGVSKETFVIRAVRLDKEIGVMFKYDGKPFNPIIVFSDTAEEALASGGKMQLALRLFNSYAQDPWYHYSYGINTLSMTIPLTDEIHPHRP